MNIEYLRESLQLVSYSGVQLLNDEQTALLEHSLVILQNDIMLANVFFWGRLTAADGDFYIAFGYLKDALRGRRFFYSKNCVEWFLLPRAKCADEESAALALAPLSGDIRHSMLVAHDPEFHCDHRGAVTHTAPEVRALLEINRLAAVVQRITDEAALLPRGALVQRVDEKAVYSPGFRGLSQLEAGQLENYVLYREPREEWNENLLKRPDYNYYTDVFDTIDSICPADRTFALSVEMVAAAARGGVVLIRSLLWPGMVFFHKCGSRKHGFVYVGDGRKNEDILFEL